MYYKEHKIKVVSTLDASIKQTLNKTTDHSSPVLDSVYYAEIGNKRFDVYYSGDVAEIVSTRYSSIESDIYFDIKQKKGIFEVYFPKSLIYISSLCLVPIMSSYDDDEEEIRYDKSNDISGYVFLELNLEKQFSTIQLFLLHVYVVETIPCSSYTYTHFAKETAKLWHESLISDRHYYSTIQQIIESKPDPRYVKLSPEENISPISAPNYVKDESKITYIPSWFKEPSLYWYQEKITDAEYFYSIEYLIESGIIQIDI